MKHLRFLLCALTFISLCSCGSTPVVVEKAPIFEPADTIERDVSLEPPDYTKDWHLIADMGYRQEYPAFVTQILWKRRNWNMTLSGEAVDDQVEDMQRRFRWDKKLVDWVAEKGNPEWPR